MKTICLYYKTIIFVCIFALASSLVLMSSAVAKDIDVLRIGIGTDVDTFNPQEQTSSFAMNINSLIYDNYFRLDSEQKMKPCLMKGYEVSKDGLTYTLELEKGIKFSDGAPLDADVVKLTFDRFLDPKLRVPLRFVLFMIKSVSVIDKYTVQIKTKYPYVPFTRMLAELILSPISPLAIEKYGDDVRRHPVGAGPYTLAEWVKGDRIVLVRNENYWGPKPTVKKMIFKIVPETATREAMLRSGEIDICSRPLPSNIKALQADPNITVKVPLSSRVIYMSMNNQKGATTSKLVRQAFNYAINKKAIVKKLLFGMGEVSKGVGSPINFGYHEMANQYEYNPEKAKDLLKKANFDFSRTIKISTPQGRYNFDKQISEAIQAQLQAIGVKAELRTYDWPTYIAASHKPLETHELELSLFGFGPTVLDVDITLFAQFHCKTNPPGPGSAFYCHPEFDDLMGQSRREQNVQKRLELLKQAEQMVWNDAAWIFLHTEKFMIAYKSKLQGLTLTNTEMFYPTYCTWK